MLNVFVNLNCTIQYINKNPGDVEVIIIILIYIVGKLRFIIL